MSTNSTALIAVLRKHPNYLHTVTYGVCASSQIYLNKYTPLIRCGITALCQLGNLVALFLEGKVNSEGLRPPSSLGSLWPTMDLAIDGKPIASFPAAQRP